MTIARNVDVSADAFPGGNDNPKVHYLVGKRENSKAKIEMCFGFSPSLRFRGSLAIVSPLSLLVPPPFVSFS